MVDQLSGGRLNLGVGSGYISLEFEGFGVDPATKRERFDAGLATLVAGMAGEPVVATRTAGMRPLNVLPLQRPHPPLWIAVQRREALPFVAKRGVSVALVPYATVASVDELADQIREFRSTSRTGRPCRSRWRSISTRATVRTGPGPRSSGISTAGSRPSRRSTRTRSGATRATPRPRRSSGRGSRCSAPPARSTDRLEAFRSAGVDEVLGIFDFGGLPVEDVRASVAALGPQFPMVGRRP